MQSKVWLGLLLLTQLKKMLLMESGLLISLIFFVFSQLFCLVSHEAIFFPNCFARFLIDPFGFASISVYLLVLHGFVDISAYFLIFPMVLIVFSMALLVSHNMSNCFNNISQHFCIFRMVLLVFS